MQYQQVIRFWFEETVPKQWWAGDPDFDGVIKERFSGLHAAAVRCELHDWRSASLGRLAEVIVLDQFSRNIHRGTAAAFASDPAALCLSQELIGSGGDRKLSENERCFAYMPFMHSESVKIHEMAVELFSDLGPANLDFELKHKAIIDRFGRYPHRNAVLGRASTPEEIEFLRQPGSSF